MNKRILFFSLLCTIFFHAAYAQRNTQAILYPLVWRTPETGIGAGCAGMVSFRINKSDSISPVSSVQLGAGYSASRQVQINLPFDLYWRNRRYQLNGEIGLYRSGFWYYGVGNRAIEREFYRVNMAQFRWQLMRKWKPHFFAGIRHWLEYYDPYDLQRDGEMIQGIIPGTKANFTSIAGLVFLYDNRDNVFASHSGHYLELSYNRSDKKLRSDFNYHRFRIDYRWFCSIGKKNVLAIQSFNDAISGDVPFQQLPMIGDSKRMRGYYQGRYRDQMMIMQILEWRRSIYKRWSAALFTSGAWVGSNNLRLFESAYHTAIGAGIRYEWDQKRHLRIRLDAALGQHSSGIYLAIGEAF